MPRAVALALALAGVVVLGTAARSLDLSHPSLSYDELSDLAQSVAFCERGEWSEPADGYINGQLPYLVACAVYRWFPPAPVVPRALSVAFGALTVAMAFLLATRFVSRPWALAAALLVATSTFAIASSRLGFTHGHGIHVPFLLLGLHLVLDPERRPAPTILGGLALGLAAGVDLLAAFTAASAAVWVVHAWRRAPHALAVVGAFAAAGLAGVVTASPMFLFHPAEAFASIREQLGQWDGLTGYLWLGELREALPASYYLVVLGAKANPLVLALAAAGAVVSVRDRSVRGVFLAACLWPIAYLSFKGWKSPFYVAAFVPLLCILATIALSRLQAWRGRRPAAAAVALALGVEAWTAAQVHPDYLMAGVQWTDALYGEFQGPAVSHGQWIGEALDFVRADAGAANPLVLMFRDVGEPQAAFYAERAGLDHVDRRSWADPVARPWALARARYVVVSQDCLRMVAPLHPEAIRANADLVALVRPPTPFRLVRSFGPAALPMVWVFRRE